MLLVMTTTVGDEMEEVLELEIPAWREFSVASFTGISSTTGRYEIPFDKAQDIIADVAFVGVEDTPNLRCWVCF